MKSTEFLKKIKDTSVEELKKMLSDMSKDLIDSKFKIALAEDKNHARISKIRHDIARIQTELRKREITK